MKKLLTMILVISFILLASTAFAERGHGRGDNGYYASLGARIDRHMDRQGDRIQHRFEHKADRAEWQGKYAKADRMRAKGERINRHLDRKGERIHARFDHRYNHKRSMHNRSHRHEHYRQPVVYRNSRAHDSYFGLVINQPGLVLGWSWRD